MFLFGKKAEIVLELINGTERKFVRNSEGKELPVYYDGENVSGKVNISVLSGKKLEHQGIVVELVGRIEYLADRGTSQEFICLEKDVARHGVLNSGLVSYPFEFNRVRKPYETYRGVNVQLRYLVRVHILQRLNNILREQEIEVHTLSMYNEPAQGVRMEVGIEDSLHIEFEYSSVRYHLEDVIIGKIYFILVRVKIKQMDLQIIRHETVGRGPTIISESSYLSKYEIMDGSPVRGECVPVRVFLRDITELRPSMIDVGPAGAFSVRYFLNLVLTDEDDRRYYKQQEILLYRKCDIKSKLHNNSIAKRSQLVQNLLQHQQQPHPSEYNSPCESNIIEETQTPYQSREQTQIVVQEEQSLSAAH